MWSKIKSELNNLVSGNQENSQTDTETIARLRYLLDIRVIDRKLYDIRHLFPPSPPNRKDWWLKVAPRYDEDDSINLRDELDSRDVVM